MKALCFEENDDINITEYTQVCASYNQRGNHGRVERPEVIKPDVAAGLSLGEYCASGSSRFDELCRRGKSSP